MKMSNKVYDVLKWISLVALDAFGLFYKTMSAIWNIPLGDEVLATCTALSIFLGTLIGISSIKHNKNNTDGDM